MLPADTTRTKIRSVHCPLKTGSAFSARHLFGRLPAALIVSALLGSTSAQAAEPHPTKVELNCGSGLIAYEPVTCQVTVTDTEAEPPSAPIGTVSLESDPGGAFAASPPCELAAVPESGERSSACTVMYEPTLSGTRTLTATYPGDLAHATSNATIMPTVEARSTTLAVSCGAGVLVSQPATCTATVTDTAAGTAPAPSGTVGFTSDTSGGAFAPEPSCKLTPGASPTQARCSVQYTPGQIGSGTHTLMGSYGGDTSHALATAAAALLVSAPAPTPPPVSVTPTPTSPSPTPIVPAPARPKCRVKARERSVLKATKRGAPKTKVLEILVTYSCDQSAAVRVGGSIAIAAGRHARRRSKAQTVRLRTLSSRAVPGGKQPGLVLMLPVRVREALKRGAETSASVEFTVSNANGIGVATIRFGLVP